jgi:hypothetical protein
MIKLSKKETLRIRQLADPQSKNWAGTRPTSKDA